MQSFKIFQVQGMDKKAYVIEAKNFDDAREIVMQHVPDFDLEHCTWSRLPTAGGVKTLTRMPVAVASAIAAEQSPPPEPVRSSRAREPGRTGKRASREQ